MSEESNEQSELGHTLNLLNSRTRPYHSFLSLFFLLLSWCRELHFIRFTRSRPRKKERETRELE